MKAHEGSDDSRLRAIHCPDELHVSFFLPMPEPLGLPQASILPTYTPPGPLPVSMLKESGVEYLLATMDGVLSGDAPSDPPRLLPQAEDWSRRLFLSSSVQVHHVQGDFLARSGLDAASVIARVATDRRRRPGELALSVLHRRNDYPKELIDNTAEHGVGEVTVLEVAVPLRLVGDLADTYDLVGLEQAGDRADPGPPCTWPFAFGTEEAPLPSRVVEGRLHQALDVAIGDIRSLQRAYQAMSRDPITLVTRERLPHAVPFVARRLGSIGAPSSGQSRAGSMEVSHNLWASLRPPQLSESQLAAMGQARARLEHGAFAAHLDLHREADVALRRQGDTRLAALLAGSSAESLLDDLLLHLQWECGLTPEAAASTWRPGLDSRVKNEFTPLLGGSWDMTGAGAVAAWATRVADLRHRVVHGAYVPGQDEARQAIATLDRLVTYLCDLLAKPKTMSRFPRTATVLAGRAGLEKRGAYTRRIRKLEVDRGETDWATTFGRWREAHRRIRRDASEPRTPSPVDADALLIRHPDGSQSWCLHDRGAGLAARSTPDVSAATPEFRSALLRVEQQAGGGTPHQPVSMAFAPALLPPMTVDDDWVEEYHLVPLAGVMVDRTDFQV